MGLSAAQVDAQAESEGVVVERLAGADRFATAAAVSQATFPDGADRAFLATGRTFADALAGGAASQGGAPVLLTEPDVLPTAAAAELARLDVDELVVLGGVAAVSAQVAADAAVAAGAPVRRLGGPDRFATAVAVSRWAFPQGVERVFVATGNDFPDALAGGVAAGLLGGPVLLSGRDELPAVTVDELRRLAPARVTVLGGPAAISDAVVDELGDVAPVDRLAGATRFATAAAVSQATFADADTVVVATGRVFADALSGTPAAIVADGPLLLVEQADTASFADAPDPTLNEVRRLQPERIVVLGGPAAVDDPTVEQLVAAATDTTPGPVEPPTATPTETESEATPPGGGGTGGGGGTPPDDDDVAPTFDGGATPVISDETTSGFTVTWPAATDDVAVTGYTVLVDGVAVDTVAGDVLTFDVTGLAPDTTYDVAVTASDEAGNVSAPIQTVATTLPIPDPGGDDPAEPPAGGSTGVTATPRIAETLYSGGTPRQQGADAGSFEPSRAGILSGRVLDTSGVPVAGARVEVVGHPEHGFTETLADGTWDLAANLGGSLVVRFTADGLLPVERTIETLWQDWTVLDDVVMTAPDAAVSTIDVSGTSSGQAQVHVGTAVADDDGPRQPFLVFPDEVTAQVRLADGTVEPAPDPFDVRITEYTLGDLAEQAMPGDLPPTSAFTYAAELSVDGVPAGATVEFSAPVSFFVHDHDASEGTTFIGFPAGTRVPFGFYDASTSRWLPDPDGVVIGIVSEAGGLAEVDTTGDGVADNGTVDTPGGPLSDDEREALATVLDVGDTAWRVPTDHFTPCDPNWPVRTTDDATGPPITGPSEVEQVTTESTVDDPDESDGFGTIEVERQVLREDIPVAGSGQALHYASDRVPGAHAVLRIPVSGATVPASLLSISARVIVAGRVFTETFPPDPNQEWTLTWDRRDRFGNIVQGAVRAIVEVTWSFPAVYTAPPEAIESFGLIPYEDGVVLPDARVTFDFSESYRVTLGRFDARVAGLGGWTLTDHHHFNPVSNTVHLGDGTRQSARAAEEVVETVGGGTGVGCYGGGCLPSNGDLARDAELTPDAVAVAEDGTAYITQDNGRPLIIHPDGTLTYLANEPGSEACMFSGGNTNPATPCPEDTTLDARTVQFRDPSDIKLHPDGRVLIADRRLERIFAIDPTTFDLTVFAGTGADCNLDADPCGDGGAATDAALGRVSFIATADDGTVYYVTESETIRAITPDGIIQTIAGTPGQICQTGTCGDGGPAGDALLASIYAPIDMAPDGSVVFVDFDIEDNAPVIRRITPDGIIDSIAGQNADRTNDGNPIDFVFVDWTGTPAEDVTFNNIIEALAVGPDGSVYLADTDGFQIWRIRPDGIVDLAAGVGPVARIWGPPGPGNGLADDGGLALQTELISPVGLDVGPDGSLWWGQGWFWGEEFFLRRLIAPYPNFDGTQHQVAAAGGQQLWTFDADGRHLTTHNTLTGEVVRAFAYDADGRLASITDGDGNVATITRDVDGEFTGIAGPFGQTTGVTVDDDGWLSGVTNPEGETTTFDHDPVGLLGAVNGPIAGADYTFTYDPPGRLTGATDPAGTTTLLRQDTEDGWAVTLTTPEGRQRSVAVQTDDALARTRTTTGFDGTQIVVTEGRDGLTTTESADGMVFERQTRPDPRLGQPAAYTTTATQTTPGGLTRTDAATRDVVLADPEDPFSLVEITEERIVNGRTSTSTYTAATRTTVETSPEGRSVTTVLNGQGRVASRQPDGLAETTYTYDARGRLCRQVTDDGAASREVTWTYDGGAPCGEAGGDPWPTTVTDPIGQTTTFTYDEVGRVLTTTDDEGQTTAAIWDDQSNPVTMMPPGQPDHLQSYDARDLRTAYDPPGDANTFTWAYDTDGLLERQDRPDGTAIDPERDGAGRIDTITTDAGSYGRSYDAAGRTSGLTAPGGDSLTVGYDGRLPTRHDLTGTVEAAITWTYDDDLRMAGETVDAETAESHTVAYAYDDDSLLTQAGDLGITRDPTTGLIIQTVLGDLVSTFTWTAFGQLDTHTVVHDATTTLYDATHTYDDLGRLVARDEEIGGDTTSWTYTYDGAGRLVEVGQDLDTRTYTYDDNGNRILGPDGEVGAYDDRDVVTGYGPRTFVYDAAGDLVSDDDGTTETTYTYDASLSLQQVDRSDGTTITYEIDPRARRIGRTQTGADPSTRTWAFHDGLNPVAEYDAAGDRRLRFVHGTSSLAPDYLVDATGNLMLVVTDVTGSPRLAVDAATGAVAQRMDYDEFGVVITDTDPGFQPFGFHGGIHDPTTGLVRMGARDYDPTLGRFTAADPIQFAGGQANLYEYAGSDPVNASDPTGLGPSDSDEETVPVDEGGGVSCDEPVFARVSSTRNATTISEQDLPLYARRDGELVRVRDGDPLFRSDQLLTGGNTAAAIKFSLGGSAILPPGGTFEFRGERDIEVTDSSLTPREVREYNRCLQSQVRIQTAGGVMAIRG